MADKVHSFEKFMKISQFKNTHHTCISQTAVHAVTYGAKVKLHGTNAAVRVSSDGTVTAQKRTADINAQSDNAGFAKWVHCFDEEWVGAVRKSLEGSLQQEMTDPVIIFGEWGGKGIQKGPEAVLKLDKHFFVFGIKIRDVYITSPESIQRYVPRLENLVVLPWFFDPETEEGMTYNFQKSLPGEEETCFIEKINKAVDRFETEDPFIMSKFGISGPGEGLVLSPYKLAGEYGNVTSEISFEEAAQFSFKAKTEPHRSQKQNAAVSRRLLVPENVAAFVLDFVTEARCLQGLKDSCENVASKRNVAAFLKWMVSDVREESKLELSQMGLEWKAVQSQTALVAKEWFLDRCETAT